MARDTTQEAGASRGRADHNGYSGISTQGTGVKLEESHRERVYEKTVTRKIIEKPSPTEPISPQATFTTEPKTIRHKRSGISGNRCREFMEHLWRKGLKKKCRYNTLRFEFISCFETNDPRVAGKYIGSPRFITRYPGATVVRRNCNSGKIAKFMYTNDRTVKAKISLMEYLGYITLDKKNTVVTLHHENMPYFTEQSAFPPYSPLSEGEYEGSSAVSSKDNLCVCHIETGGSKRQHVASGSCIEVEKKEEEVIDYTHKSVKPKMQQSETDWKLADNDR